MGGQYEHESTRGGIGGMGWIDLAQERDRWKVLVNAVKDVLVLQNSMNFLTS